MNEHNPYQTPNSDLTTPNHSLSIRHAFDWVRLAWGLFWQKPFMWIISTFLWWVVVLLAMIMAFSVLPVLALVVQAYFLFIYYGSVVFIAKAKYTARTVDMADGMVFMSENLKSFTLLFAIIAVIYAVYGLMLWGVITGLMMLFVKFSHYEQVYFYLNTNWSSFALTNLLNNYLVLAIYWVIFLPVIMATLFMPLLVIFDNYKIKPALRLSFKSYLKNITPLTVYVLIQFVISFVLLYATGYLALFALMLFLVFFPMSLMGISIAYFDIFHISPNHSQLNQQNSEI
ncbi:hypothetical protein [Moraxella oblonga]|uniref:hypothetical protein n=1 Tax=Moraxella oblonga TaxID=200413 RepID=UPI0008371AD8|nr:hypothetical protein [Moraxella oblonga]